MTRLAALDLGSNSFHLLVADELPGRAGIKRVATRKLTLRLGKPVARDGELGRDARRRALAAVDELVGEARRHGAEVIAAVATQALRQAGDSEKLREKLAAAHGLDVRVVEGLEEGYLSLRGMAGALRLPAGGEVLGLDLGGGSYEVVYGGTGPLVAGASLPLGSAVAGDRLLHDPPRLAERAALHDEALFLLSDVVRAVRKAREGDDEPLRAVGTAGTIRDLGRVGLALASGAAPERVRGVIVSRDQFERAYARLCSVPTTERLELPGLSAKRADLLPAGGAVLLATMEAFGLEQLELCDWGLREGMVLDALSDGELITEADFHPL